MINVLVTGVCGKMGQNVVAALGGDGKAKAVCGVDIAKSAGDLPVYKNFGDVKEKVDVIIDFSSPAALKSELEWAKSKHVPVVLAATGYSDGDMQLIEKSAEEIAVFKSANFSVGICLLKKLVREAADGLGENFDIEIVERHHRLKADAPSGTALALADSANAAFAEKKPYICGRDGVSGRRGREIGIHSVRGGTIVGVHEVIFAGADEVITLSHSAQSKKIFAEGAIKAAKWICGKKAGLYDMDDMLAN